MMIITIENSKMYLGKSPLHPLQILPHPIPPIGTPRIGPTLHSWMRFYITVQKNIRIENSVGVMIDVHKLM
jgi:hypothetical protein